MTWRDDPLVEPSSWRDDPLVEAAPSLLDPAQLVPDAAAPPVAPLDPIAAEMQRIDAEQARKQQLREEYARSKGFASFDEMRGGPTIGERLSSAKDYFGERSIPFVSSGLQAVDATQIMLAANRIKDGTHSPEDVSRVAQYLREQRDEGDQGFWSQVFDTVARVPAFAGELYATGGIYTAGKQAAQKVAGEAVERSLVGKGLEFAATRGAGVAAQTATNPTQVAGAVARQMTPEIQQTVDEAGNTVGVELGDPRSFLEALPRGFADAMIEIGSERAGGILGKAGYKVLSKLPFADKVSAIQRAVVNRWMSKPGRTVETLQSTLRQAGWNGVLGEVLEERVGDIGRLATGLEGAQDNVTGQLATGDFGPALEQLLVEGVAFTVPGAAAGLANVAAAKIDSQVQNTSKTDNLSPKPRPPVPDIDIEDINIPGVTFTPGPQRAAPKSARAVQAEANQAQQAVNQESEVIQSGNDQVPADEVQRGQAQAQQTEAETAAQGGQGLLSSQQTPAEGVLPVGPPVEPPGRGTSTPSPAAVEPGKKYIGAGYPDFEQPMIPTGETKTYRKFGKDVEQVLVNVGSGRQMWIEADRLTPVTGETEESNVLQQPAPKVLGPDAPATTAVPQEVPQPAKRLGGAKAAPAVPTPDVPAAGDRTGEEGIAPGTRRLGQPPIVRYREEAAEIEKQLPPVPEGHIRLWRGNRPNEEGVPTSYTDDLPGIALPFRKSYGGPLTYVDVPQSEAKQFEYPVGTATARGEYEIPQELAAKAQSVDDKPSAEPVEAPLPAVDAVKLTEDGEFDLSTASTTQLRRIVRRGRVGSRGYVSNRPEESLRLAARNELVGRGEKEYTDGPPESRPLWDAYNTAKHSREEAEATRSEKASAAEKTLHVLVKKIASSSGVPEKRRGKFGLSEAKSHAKRIQAAVESARKHPDYIAAVEAEQQAKAGVEQLKGVEQDAKRTYYRSIAESFPKIPSGQRRHVLDGPKYSYVDVQEYDPDRGQYRTITSGGIESFIDPQPLLDNYVTEQELADVEDFELRAKKLRNEFQSAQLANRKEAADREAAERLTRSRAAAKGLRGELLGKGKENPAETSISADIVLDATDLGVGTGTDKRFEFERTHERLKQIAKAAPEFAHDPIFTVNADKNLVFKDGVTYTLAPEMFNLSKYELAEGQTVGINLEDIGLRQLTAQEAVVAALKNEGFKKVKKMRNGSVSATWAGRTIEVSGAEQAWEVAEYSDPAGAEASARVKQLLKKMHFLAPVVVKAQKPNKTKKKTARSIMGLAEEGPVLEAPRPSIRQTRTEAPKVSTDDEAGVAAQDIIRTWERIFNVPIRVGGFSQRASGIYKVLPEVVRLKEKHVANLAVAAHEVAHHIDKDTGIRDKIPGRYQAEVESLDYEPKGRIWEGFAEFIRHYIAEHDAQQQAPEFFDWFTNTWMPEHPKWAAALKEAKKHARKYADQSVFQRIRAQIGYQPGDDLEFKERWTRQMRSFSGRAHRAMVDRFSPLKLVQEEAAKRGIDQRAGVYDVAMAYDMSATPNAMMALEKGVHSITKGRLLGKKHGLWDLAEQLKTDAEYDEAVTYTYARHTLHMAKVKPGFNTGLDLEDAKSWLEYVKAEPGKAARFEEFAKGLAEFNNDLLEMLVDAGALDRDAKDRMVKMYGKFYMPLHRAVDGGGLFGSGSRFVNLPPAVRGRSRLGSGRKIIDPLDATIARATYFYGRAAQARVAHRLARTLDPEFGGVEGLGGLMDKIDPKKKVHEGIIGEILDPLVEEGVIEADEAKSMRIAAEIRQAGNTDSLSQISLEWFAGHHGLDRDDTAGLVAAAENEPDALATIALWRADYTPSAVRATVVIHDRHGKPVLYEMDRELYKTVTGMDELHFRGFLKMMRGASRYFKSGAVGLSTGFGTANLVRDYVEYQGKAEHVQGLASLGTPAQMLQRYVAYKARQMAGLPTDDALITTFEEMGGKIYSRIGHDVESRTRSRRRQFAKSWSSRFGVSLSAPGETAETALEAIQEAIAISDAPPRLAEMLAVARKNGYEPVGDAWRKDGRQTDLPEWLRIQMANAAAEATVNFKRVGWAGRYVEAFVPFFNATVQAAYRQGVQLRSLRRLGRTNETKQEKREEQQAVRALVYLSALASTSALVWMLRHDDDDYREQEPWLKNGYWTWGKNGITIFRVPKPRDAAIVANVTESILDGWHHSDSQSVGETIGRDLLGRVPTGGGLLRGGVESLVANYDYFRGRPLVPEYLQHEPKQLQFTPYTLETSKKIGQVTGKYLGLSPIQVEHLLDSAFGGAYRRLVGGAEAAAKGEAGMQHVPFVRGVVVNRHQARSVNDFYQHRDEVAINHQLNEAGLEADRQLLEERPIFEDYAAIMTEIRKVEPKGLGGKRKFEYEPYIVGLARDALGYDPLPHNPNPFYDPNVPAPIKGALLEHSVRQVKRAILSEGMPQKVRKGDASYEETLSKWKARQTDAEKWLREHRASPIVQEAMDQIRSSESYRNLLTMRQKPIFTANSETWEEHLADWNRWMEKANTARKWLGEPD